MASTTEAQILQTLNLMRTDTVAILAAIAGLPTSAYVIRQDPYKANKNGTGYSTSDYIQRNDIILAATGVVSSSVYFNMTTGAVIAAPLIADIDPYIPPESVTVSNTVAVTLPTGAQTVTSSTATDSTGSPVTAGATEITFTTNSTFAGTINGVARNASTVYVLDSVPGKTLPAVTYTVTGGSMVIDKTV